MTHIREGISKKKKKKGEDDRDGWGGGTRMYLTQVGKANQKGGINARKL
jgi:hypothetical protein